MSKRHKNPYSNDYYCEKTPHKVRYLKAAFAFEVGAKRIKAEGIALYLYRCECKGWHLTKKETERATRIETKAAPREEEPRED